MIILIIFEHNLTIRCCYYWCNMKFSAENHLFCSRLKIFIRLIILILVQDNSIEIRKFFSLATNNKENSFHRLTRHRHNICITCSCSCQRKYKKRENERKWLREKYRKRDFLVYTWWEMYFEWFCWGLGSTSSGKWDHRIQLFLPFRMMHFLRWLHDIKFFELVDMNLKIMSNNRSEQVGHLK